MRERGHSLAEIARATEEGRLAFGFLEELFPSDQERIRPGGRARRPGSSRRWSSAGSRLGLSPGHTETVSEDDVQLLRYVAAVLDSGFPLVALLQLVRVYGQAMAQIADAEVRLFHLYVHEPLMRAGSTGVEMAEEMDALSRELLPLASPVMDQIHQRYLQHFLEQDVVGHMEADLDGRRRPRPDAGRDRVRRPGRLHAPDRGGGRAEAVDAVERFVEAVEITLPDDARVIKTIGDEVMIVSSDPAALTDWAVGFQRLQTERPLPRIGIHYGVALYRDGDYYGREVNIAARVAARSAGGEVLVTRPVVENAAGSAPRVRADRRREAEGIQRADRDLPRPAGGGGVIDRARSATRGCWRRGPRRSWSCSPVGGTRSACSTSPSGSPARRRSAPYTSTTGCATPPSRRAPLRRGLRALGVRSTSAGPPARGPSESGNLQAWARDVRYGAAAEGVARAPTSPPATPPPTRWRRSSTGWRPRRAGARCSGCAPSGTRCSVPCSGSRASRPAPTARARAALARRRVNEPPPTRAPVRRELFPRSSAPSRGRRKRARARRDPPRRGRVLDTVLDDALRRRQIELARLRELVPRSPAGRPAAGRRGHAGPAPVSPPARTSWRAPRGRQSCTSPRGSAPGCVAACSHSGGRSESAVRSRRRAPGAATHRARSAP